MNFNFDIKTFIAAALANLQTSFGTSWPNVKDQATKFFTEKEARLKELATSRLNNEITDQFFFERVKDEASILQSEGAALAVLGEAKAEGILNGFATFFQATLLNILEAQV